MTKNGRENSGNTKIMRGLDPPEKKIYYSTIETIKTTIKTVVSTPQTKRSVEENKAFRNRLMCMYTKRFNNHKDGNVNRVGKGLTFQ